MEIKLQITLNFNQQYCIAKYYNLRLFRNIFILSILRSFMFYDKLLLYALPATSKYFCIKIFKQKFRKTFKEKVSTPPKNNHYNDKNKISIIYETCTKSHNVLNMKKHFT